jgi:hypothetical protein
LGESEGGEGCLNPRGGITQQIKVLHRASSVADLQFDTVACKYPCVLPRKVVVPGSCHPGSDCEVTRRQRIDQSIYDVQDGKDNGRPRKHNYERPRLVAKLQATGPAEFQVGDVIAIILTLLAHNVRLAPGQLQRNPFQALQLLIWCREGGLTCRIVRR